MISRDLPLTFVMMLACISPAAAQAPHESSPKRYAIAVHGGAGSWAETRTAEDRAQYEVALQKAVTAGREVLEQGGTALDAVERVVCMLEDDPKFNAGRGAVFNAAGGHELDASIMDGRTKACGAVGGVRTVKNPISLARLVMTDTPHVLLVGDGAEAFADEANVERVTAGYFHTDKQYQNFLRAQQPPQNDDQQAVGDNKGTVGCVALDSHGNLAAGTSTGGLVMKRYGRIGDSPIIGAGTYADNETCAVSCTGIGEEFIRHAIAHDLSARIKHGKQTLEEAAKTLIHETLKPNTGGLIAIDRHGNIVMPFNTPGMARAAADSSGKLELGL